MLAAEGWGWGDARGGRPAVHAAAPAGEGLGMYGCVWLRVGRRRGGLGNWGMAAGTHHPVQARLLAKLPVACAQPRPPPAPPTDACTPHKQSPLPACRPACWRSCPPPAPRPASWSNRPPHLSLNCLFFPPSPLPCAGPPAGGAAGRLRPDRRAGPGGCRPAGGSGPLHGPRSGPARARCAARRSMRSARSRRRRGGSLSWRRQRREWREWQWGVEQ